MQAMFAEIDDWNYKYIDIKNLKRFLMKTSVYPDDNSLRAILRRLDTDGDARLSFREFSMAVQPQIAPRQTLDIDEVPLKYQSRNVRTIQGAQTAEGGIFSPKNMNSG